MPHRRALSLWFPRLLADRLLRREPQLAGLPFVIAAEERQMQVIAGLSAPASAQGLKPGMALSEARALCPGLISRAADPAGAAAFLASLRRWAGRFSPWVAEEGADALVLDITGCAHLFGGEPGLATEIHADCARLGLTVRIGIADTVGAAWAVARFAGAGIQARHSGDAIDQEAPATRARAAKRRNWERGGTPPLPKLPDAAAPRIVPPGRSRATLGPLPLTALRLDEDAVQALLRLGLRRIEDLATLPRAALARRAGPGVVRRLDQAFGAEPEPVSPARPPHHFAARMSFPEPIGLETDIRAGIDRLLVPLCARLETAGKGARTLRLTAVRTDGGRQIVEVSLARPARDPARIAPLLGMRIGDIEAGFGIDMLRLEAVIVEKLAARQHSGHAEAQVAGSDALGELISRLGVRLGVEMITRLHPADSHIPEKSATILTAAYAAPAPDWPAPTRPRPIRLFPPEPLWPEKPGPVTGPEIGPEIGPEFGPEIGPETGPETGSETGPVTGAGTGTAPPPQFRWRRRRHRSALALGPERLLPEWWLDDPAWRSGPRDYWRIETEDGLRLWAFRALGGETGGGWFVQGEFA